MMLQSNDVESKFGLLLLIVPTPIIFKKSVDWVNVSLAALNEKVKPSVPPTDHKLDRAVDGLKTHGDNDMLTLVNKGTVAKLWLSAPT